MNHEKVTMYGHLGIILAYLASNKQQVTYLHIDAMNGELKWL